MSNGHEDHNVVGSDAGREEETQDRWYIYTAHYPKSLTRVPMLRMIIRNGYGLIVAVTDVEGKKGRIISDCDPRKGEHGPYFSTYSDHQGHLALCRHLQANGIRGNYLSWLEAKEAGKNAWADEYSGEATIRFSTRMTPDTLEDWEIDWGFVDSEKQEGDPAAEEDVTSEPTIEELEAQIKAKREAATESA